MDQRAQCEQIRLSTTGLVARHINKRISLPMSRWIANNTRWTPNQITYFNIVVGFSSGFIAALGTPLSLFLAALILQIASILDGVDGEVAKLTKTSSQWGQWLDSISDNGTLASFLIGTTVGLGKLYPSSPILALSLLTFGSFLLIIGTMLTFLRLETNSGSFVTYDKEFISKLSADHFPVLGRVASVLKYTVKKDFFSMLFFLIAASGHPIWILYLCSYGGALAFLIMAYFHVSLWIRSRSGKVSFEGEHLSEVP